MHVDIDLEKTTGLCRAPQLPYARTLYHTMTVSKSLLLNLIIAVCLVLAECSVSPVPVLSHKVALDDDREMMIFSVAVAYDPGAAESLRVGEGVLPCE